MGQIQETGGLMVQSSRRGEAAKASIARTGTRNRHQQPRETGGRWSRVTGGYSCRYVVRSQATITDRAGTRDEREDA